MKYLLQVLAIGILLSSSVAQAETRPPRYTWTGPTIYSDGTPLDFLTEIVRLQVQCSKDNFTTLVIDEEWFNDSDIVPTGVADQYQRFGDGGLPNSSTHICRMRAAIDDVVAGLVWADWAVSPPFKIRGKPGVLVFNLVQ